MKYALAAFLAAFIGVSAHAAPCKAPSSIENVYLVKESYSYTSAFAAQLTKPKLNLDFIEEIRIYSGDYVVKLQWYENLFEPQYGSRKITEGFRVISGMLGDEYQARMRASETTFQFIVNDNVIDVPVPPSSERENLGYTDNKRHYGLSSDTVQMQDGRTLSEFLEQSLAGSSNYTFAIGLGREKSRLGGVSHEQVVTVDIPYADLQRLSGELDAHVAKTKGESCMR